MKIYKIYLDDIRTPIDQSWKVVRSYQEFVSFVRLIGLEKIQLISLDHDLGDQAMSEFYNNVVPNYIIEYNNIQEKTGLDAAKWLVNYSMTNKIALPRVLTHSANPVGAANIMGYVNSYLMNCRLPQDCVRHRVAHN